MPAIRRQQTFHPRLIPCPISTCGRYFSNNSGLNRHVSSYHPSRPHAPPATAPSATAPSVHNDEDIPEDIEMGGPGVDEEDEREHGNSEADRHSARDGCRVEYHPYLDGTSI